MSLVSILAVVALLGGLHLGVGPAGAVSVPLATTPAEQTTEGQTPAEQTPEVTGSVRNDVSRPLRDMPQSSPTGGGGELPLTRERPPRPTPVGGATSASPVVPAADPAPMPAPIENFEGMDNPNGYYPPDANGDVGPNHYVQMVNVSLAIYDKAGNLLLGPVNNNMMWGGFGGECQNTNDGDPIVQYDGLADRWLISQFSVSGAESFECVAISTSPDPLGSYYRYAFSYGTDFPDYPKVGVWPDGYYVTYNVFDDAGFAGVTVCALERRAMLVGDSAYQQCADLPEAWSLLPADVDGPTPPPVGAPNYLVGLHWFDNDKLTEYMFHVDWDDPANSTFSAPVDIPVAPYTPACTDVNRGRCVPQPGTAVLLESLGNKTMYRLAYRNFGTHESLLTNQTVALDGNPGLSSQLGVRWYEIRSPGATPVLHQEGTSQSDTAGQFRWMASMAMDRQGNIGLGYSSSSTTLFPSIHYTGRLATDPLGTMPFTEGTIMVGAGSQTGTSARWGDYTSMMVDPLDDCTFWYTNQYMKATSARDWSTQIASFKFPGCVGSSAAPGAPATVTATPGNAEVAVAWTPPTDDGGLPITGYTVTASPDGDVCETLVGVDSDPLSCTFTGLTNGTEYTFEVTATNALGTGPAVTSAGATPATVPAPPVNVVAAAGNTQATVSWTAPADTGGSAITGYTATAIPGGASCTTPAGATPVPTSCTVTGLANGTPYTFTVVTSNDRGSSGPSGPSAPVTPLAPPVPPALVSMDPVRVADTRPGQPVAFPTPKATVPSGGTLEVPVAGLFGVPADAGAVSLNVTVVGPETPGHVTVFPCGVAEPNASTVNFAAGEVIANAALAQPGTDGKVCVFTSSTTDLVVDLNGYLPTGAGFTSQDPVRVADTRPGQPVAFPTPKATVPSGGTLEVPVAGLFGVPADAGAVSLNVTVVGPQTAGHVKVFPCGVVAPNASTVNFAAGQVIANMALAQPGTDGKVCVFSSSITDIVVDLNGWFTASPAFTSLAPVRVADTRPGTPVAFPLPKAKVPSGGTLEVPVAGLFGVPADAGAASLNVTVVRPETAGHVTVFPCGVAEPNASTVNFAAGEVIANAALTKVGAGGKVCVTSSSITDIAVDLNGWFPPSPP